MYNNKNLIFSLILSLTFLISPPVMAGPLSIDFITKTKSINKENEMTGVQQCSILAYNTLQDAIRTDRQLRSEYRQLNGDGIAPGAIAGAAISIVIMAIGMRLSFKAKDTVGEVAVKLNKIADNMFFGGLISLLPATVLGSVAGELGMDYMSPGYAGLASAYAKEAIFTSAYWIARNDPTQEQLDTFTLFYLSRNPNDKNLSTEELWSRIKKFILRLDEAGNRGVCEI